MNDKIWKTKEKAPKEHFEEFSDYPDLVAQVLFNRGILNKKEADQFFEPNYEKDLIDPFLALDMERALKRIKKAINKKEKILIYHDYDADGVCSAVVVASTLKAFGVDFDTYTPDRQKEGYSLNKAAVENIIAKNKPDLIITTDCGTSNVDEVEILNNNGVDVVVIDHHLPPKELPKAYAIVNPKRENCDYSFKYLCAAGVAFKLCSALLKSDVGKEHEIPEGFEKWLLDVVAIATVADMMPLLGENRTLVKYGMMVIAKTKRVGLKKMLGNSAFEKRGMSTEMIAFNIAPKINATSRMTHASVSFDLLFTESEDDAEKLLKTVETANNDRRKFVEKAVKDAIFWIEKDLSEKKELPEVFVMGNDDWTPGIVGLIAGKLADKYNKPAFVYGRVGKMFKGSCRGILGFDIFDAMTHCSEKDKSIFKSFGGHSQAGGFSVPEEKIIGLKEALLEFAKTNKKNISKDPVLELEYEISADDINWDIYKWLAKLEPFGQGNTMPVFSVSGFELMDARLVGNGEKHLKLNLRTVLSDGKVKFFDAIGFGLGGLYENIKKGDKIDAAFNIDENEWNGNKSLQLKLVDIKKNKN